MYKRKLIDYLPTVIRETREYKAILNDGEETEVISLWDSLDNAFKDQFIQDATEYGISRWEKLLKITPKATANLDERRFTILTKINEQLPFTMANLKEQLRALCGDDGYSVELDADAYTLNVEIALAAKSMQNDAILLLQRVCPANLVVNVALKYNQYSTIMGFRHNQLSGFTHNEIKETTSFKDDAWLA